MVTPSCSDVLLLALVAVASVSVFHTVARPIVPDVRPLNCAFCVALWVSMGFAAHLWTLEAVVAIPVAGFFAAVASGQWPWAFYTAVVAEVQEAPQLASPEPPGKV